MNIKDLEQRKNIEHMTNEEIADLSGIPGEIVEKIFAGEIKEPNYLMLLAIEQVLVKKEKLPFRYDKQMGQPYVIAEKVAAYNFNARQYNITDAEKAMIGGRIELIDGKLFVMATPSRMHQFLVTKILVSMANHIEGKGKGCHIYTAPLGVRLFADDNTWVVPDISVICKKEILTDAGCDGAPDLVVEIVSPSNTFHDYVTKLMKYQQAGVREYWIVDPAMKKVSLVCFEDTTKNAEYTYEDVICSNVLEDFGIRIADFIETF